MSPAEFDTRRRSLGLSVDETAALCGVQDRTVRRWQSGATPIPADASGALESLEDAMGLAVDELVTFATDRVAKGPVLLWRYRTQAEQDRSPHARSLPLGAHAMMIAWAADALEAEGIDVDIEWAGDEA
ncbi:MULTISPECIES: helix-turn-helix domain-containing protein [Sphingomonadales]|uniref:Uncharacterized protein n=1 Tax=Edaphosphingomonas haloaromaticamans TaxID=653954 RepID=A0A1S1HH88_9SPHN|nr:MULTISPECIES: helix-turn-helix domain-containing protein [Sphingomonas]AGH48785.1 putative helix-turn helix protein [Sphingomonas sp. MM-1]OHT19890.1 hypothetical protein BHE75_01883 [Sphingomonas haloaromaticamans]